MCIVSAKLPQCLADALSAAAVRLAVDDHRIDGTPDIVNCGVTHEFERSGLRIDFHFANMSPIRKAQLLDRLATGGGKQAAQLMRQRRVVGGRCRGVKNTDRAHVSEYAPSGLRRKPENDRLKLN